MAGCFANVAGRWCAEGYVFGPESTPVVGTEVYEPLAGGRFLIHHIDLAVGDRAVLAMEVLGEPDWYADQILVRCYESTGAIHLAGVRVSGDVWRFAGESPLAQAAHFDGHLPPHVASRSILRVDSDHQSMTGLWVYGDGARWVPWMEIIFTRD